jgi:hypothetical protein
LAPPVSGTPAEIGARVAHRWTRASITTKAHRCTRESLYVWLIAAAVSRLNVPELLQHQGSKPTTDLQ